MKPSDTAHRQSDFGPVPSRLSLRTVCAYLRPARYRSQAEDRAGRYANAAALMDPTYYRTQNSYRAQEALKSKTALIPQRASRQPDTGTAPEGDLVRDFLDRGAARGWLPNAIFDSVFYCRRHGLKGRRPAAAIFDYMDHGAAAGRMPNALFDVAWYAAKQALDAPANALAHYLEAVRSRTVPTSPLFDISYYRAHDPDADAFGFDALSAYMVSGLTKGISPNWLFDGHWYAQAHGIVGGVAEALRHYATEDHERTCDPHPLFDVRWYLDRNPDVARSGMNPLAHYLENGADEGRSPHALFDPKHYEAQPGDWPRSHLNPLIDYLSDERNWRKSTHPLFDGAYYQASNPDVVEHRVNPLRHYVQSGAGEGRRPCPLFDSGWYLQTYPDVAAERRNPLVDYVTAGSQAGRNPNIVFDSAWYLETNSDVAEVGLNPLSHYALTGWKERRDPGPDFDTSWYQARYGETNRGDVNALVHYLTSGMAAGYAPRPIDRNSHDCDALDIPFEILKAPSDLAERDVCLFVIYTADGAIADHVATTLDSYRQAGMTIVLVLATDGLATDCARAVSLADGVLARANHGWDFAAWATALAVFPDLWRATLLILANDSLYGPTSQQSLSQMLQRIRANRHDVVGLTDSYQSRRHMMSYFTAITPSGLRHPAVRAFWNGIRSNRDKDTVIREYELKSIERCLRDSVSFDVLFPARADEPEPRNPTLAGWKDLCDRGFPFMKVQLLRDFADRHKAKGWARFFQTMPDLTEQIGRHLAESGRHRTVATRPVPAPKRRFRQPERLVTYYGATTAIRPSSEVDLALEVPFAPAASPANQPERVAVIAHIFYVEFCADLLARLVCAPVPMDLFISTDTADKMVAITEAFNGYHKGRVEIRICPNVGRDIAPMLVGFRDVFDRYDVFLHLHSKRSPHRGDLAPWRDFLLTNLLGSPDIIRSILDTLTHGDVGMVFSQHFPPVRALLNFGHNFEAMRALLARCGVDLVKDLVLEFPSGSFFWGRSAAIRPLLDLDLRWADFPAEAAQIDGTMAHAIERSLLYMVEAAGFDWVKVAVAGATERATLVPVTRDRALAVARVHSPVIGNRVQAHKDAASLSEINPWLTRRDRNERPRLNLVVPTLQPAKVFGGLTTALRFFHDLAAKLGPGVDLRIITTSEHVDLLSMAPLGGFCLVQTAAPHDTFPKVVLDASERQRGHVGIRRHDVFIATAWWTAAAAFLAQDNQELYFGSRQKLLYLVQDHEPNFYNWSSHYQAAQRTYGRAHTVTILNSEELATAFLERYRPPVPFVLPFKLNPAIKAAVSQQPRERIILVYGRPSVARNCFEAISKALARWQQTKPVEAMRWRVISAGEDFDPVTVSHVERLEVVGKLSLDEYGALLSRASVGLSLMASPHPSYPPLEMAYAGLRTVTNAFGNKGLTRRSPNILSVPDLDADTIAQALTQAVGEATPFIGRFVGLTPIADIACPVPVYDHTTMADTLRRAWRPPSRGDVPQIIAAQ